MIHGIVLSRDQSSVLFKVGLSNEYSFEASIDDISLISPTELFERAKKTYEIFELEKEKVEKNLEDDLESQSP